MKPKIYFYKKKNTCKNNKKYKNLHTFWLLSQQKPTTTKTTQLTTTATNPKTNNISINEIFLGIVVS